ncbi:MAG: hypothetical protein COB54_00125 [Alphaproteobacteria bacterium]|nr:MAG: hypothetical protein COB54_00125 [Alphaproteobacteria bacterium]
MKISDLIITKLNPAVINRYTVERPRLLDKLQSATKAGTKLILLHAPAGFGKTTLLSQWAEHQTHLCWYSLDQKDSDSRRFLKYFIATLDKVGAINGKEALAYLESRVSHDYEDIIRLIVNNITAFSEQVCIVLDNFHVISGDTVINIIVELLNFAPNNLQLLVASQSSANFNVSSMMMPGSFLEITKEDLRFNLEEAQNLINSHMSTSVNDLLAQELLDKTEGWGAVLHLALASRPKQEPLADFIHTFSGSTREITQYLATAIFENLDEESRQFLLTTCILDRFNPQVASLVSGIKSPQKVIDRLEETGLFIVQLDVNLSWYKFHNIAREYLLAQVNREDSSYRNIIYQRAYEWFLAEGLQEEAISYALEAGNITDAILLVEDLAMDLVKEGAFSRLQSWIKNIPEQHFATQPSLIAYNCWALIHMGLCQQAEHWLDKLFQIIRAEENKTGAGPEWQHYKIEHQVLSLANAAISDRLDMALKLIPVSVPEDPEYALWAGTVYNSNAVTYLAYNEFALARSNVGLAREKHQLCDCSIGLIYTYCVEALIEYEQGRFYACQMAVDHMETMLKERGINIESSAAALIKIPKAAVLYAWNQINGASDLLTRYLPLIEECSYIEIRNLAFITLARISHQQGQTDTALSLLDRSLEINSECSLARSKILITCEKMKLLLASDRLGEMHKQMRSIGMQPSKFPELPDNWDPLECLQIFVWCLYKVNLEPHSNLIPTIEHMQKLAQIYGRFHHMLDIMLLHVRLLLSLQRPEDALTVLAASMDWAENEDYLRLYLNQGSEIEGLLRKLLKQNEIPIQREKFIRRILAAFSVQEQETYKRQPHLVQTPYQISPRRVRPVDELSRRELAILELINEGLQNKSIAFQLSIATNTVRWHVSNILGKLNVNNRTQAVTVARKLNLLKP